MAYEYLGKECWGLEARLATLLCKKITVGKFEEVKTGCYLAESSKERSVLPMMMIMMTMI
jgi:hypothetical protein